MYVDQGIYKENIVLKSKVTVLGDNPEFTNIIASARSPVIKAVDIQDAVIEGFTIRGAGKSSTGIYVENSTITIKNNWVTGVYGEGIWCISSTPIIENNIISLNWGSGIFLQSTHPDALIYENKIINNGFAGVKIEDKGNVSIRNNQISSNKGSGIHAEIAGTVIVEYNAIIKNNLAGVTCYTVSKVDLGGGPSGSSGNNSIHSNGTTAIWNATRLICAQRNWWGTTDPQDSLFLGKVDWSDWLTAPPDLHQEELIHSGELFLHSSETTFYQDRTHEKIPLEWEKEQNPKRKVIFESARYGQYELVITNIDGSDLTRLTNAPRSDELPNWKPDGRWVVFSSQYLPFYDLYMINETERVQLTFRGTYQHNMSPAWHPTESKIAYHTFETVYNGEIMLMDIINGGPGPETRLTFNECHDGGVAWSPDGNQLAFYSNRNGQMDIYTMDINGENIKQLTTNPHADLMASWSPNGKSVIYHSKRDGNGEIYQIDLETLEEKRLTFHPADDLSPSWSPDGKFIAFHSNRSGNYDIIVMEADGSNQCNITQHFREDMDPQWSPW